MEYESDSNTVISGALGKVPKGLVKRLEELEIGG